ncbi:6-pyruvoyl tetrahydropterin synthase [Chromatium okenii]|nr:6-carboxytetrahydropterin synthase [Chromatium okenii]MBK1642283.1 6-pyruvoyl tetrahydropterin synthase [Chromatium okenii]
MTAQLLYVATAPFQAARRLTTVPSNHPSQRLHGHGFSAQVRAQLPPDWADFAGAATGQLTAAVTAGVAALDYRDLNTLLPEPSDAALAQWLQTQLALPAAAVAVRSTPEQGAVVTAAGVVQLWRRFRFEAAHRLPQVPPGHPCGRMHGHSFEVVLHAIAPPSAVTFEPLDALWQPCHAALAHRCLNDIPGLENPTSELLAQWLWQRLHPQLAALTRVTVHETATAGCHYDGQRFRIWKAQRFESAVQFAAAPPDEPRRRLHGHSYLLRLHLSAPLDTVRGWTVDYGDVKALFMPIYQQLDHQRLDELPHLPTADPGLLAQWLRERCGTQLPQLDRIDVYETPGCGAILNWENPLKSAV